jgi:hypothetical protein
VPGLRRFHSEYPALLPNIRTTTDLPIRAAGTGPKHQICPLQAALAWGFQFQAGQSTGHWVWDQLVSAGPLAAETSWLLRRYGAALPPPLGNLGTNRGDETAPDARITCTWYINACLSEAFQGRWNHGCRGSRGLSWRPVVAAKEAARKARSAWAIRLGHQTGPNHSQTLQIVHPNPLTKAH